jgi:hypothetical protein
MDDPLIIQEVSQEKFDEIKDWLEHPQTRVEVSAAVHRAMIERVKRLETKLEEVLGYFDARAEMVYGPTGEPAPNKEMILAVQIREALL